MTQTLYGMWVESCPVDAAHPAGRVYERRELPANRNLEFVRLLGTIYYRRHDHLDLLRKKYTYFAEELRRNLLLDIDDQENEDANIRLLAQKTGIDEEQVRATLTKVRDCVDNGNVSEKQLFDCIDQINKIIKRL